MFDKFGEFDSAEEINRAAAAQKAEGDEEAVHALAGENGLDEEDAADFLNGDLEELTSPRLAALGKLAVEKAALKLDKVLMDWAEEVDLEAGKDDALAAAVRKKGKSLAGYIALLASDGFKNKAVVDKEIVKLCDKEIRDIVGNHEFYIGVPDRLRRKQLMMQYYLPSGKEGK